MSVGVSVCVCRHHEALCARVSRAQAVAGLHLANPAPLLCYVVVSYNYRLTLGLSV